MTDIERRSEDFGERSGLAAVVLAQRFLGERPQLFRLARQFFLPRGFNPRGLDDLRGDRVLLLLRKGSDRSHGVFELRRRGWLA